LTRNPIFTYFSFHIYILQPGKCLYTTLRELVENGLDSCESIGVLPDIEIVVEEFSRARLNALRGIEHHDRIDEELYQDFETEDEKKRRLAKEHKDKERSSDRRESSKPGYREACFYRVTVTDNGSGMPHKEIPQMLGQVLSGTKYGVKQTRGKFGLGAKMALIWSKMTTGAPFQIRSARQDQNYVSVYVLDIDIHRNEPSVHHESKAPNTQSWRGSKLSLTIEGNWSTYRSKILKYLRQIAVITPYARFTFAYKPEDERAGGSLDVEFKRRTTIMPSPPRETRHHPRSVDLELVRRLLHSSSKGTILQFLQSSFVCVDRTLACRLIEEMRSGIVEDTPPSDLDPKQIVRLHQLLHQVRFPDPKSDHLSPAGEYNLRLGVVKELHPEMVATHCADPKISEGHVSVVEAAVSIGGRDVKPGLNIFRFANRIPLLFEAGSDVITKTATKRINWSAYKINQSTDKVGVFVSIVSTKIPFKGAGKEYISDDDPEIVAAVRSAIQSCCLQLRTKLARAAAAREQKQRKRGLEKYVPNVCASLFSVLKAISDRKIGEGGEKRREQEMEGKETIEGEGEENMEKGHNSGDGKDQIMDKISKRRRKEEVVQGVREGKTTQKLLEQKLKEHIERIDMDMAMEYHMQQGLLGVAKAPLFLRAASHTSNIPEFPTSLLTSKGARDVLANDEEGEMTEEGDKSEMIGATTVERENALNSLFDVFNRCSKTKAEIALGSGSLRMPTKHRYLPGIATEGAEIQIMF